MAPTRNHLLAKGIRNANKLTAAARVRQCVWVCVCSGRVCGRQPGVDVCVSVFATKLGCKQLYSQLTGGEKWREAVGVRVRVVSALCLHSLSLSLPASAGKMLKMLKMK